LDEAEEDPTVLEDTDLPELPPRGAALDQAAESSRGKPLAPTREVEKRIVRPLVSPLSMPPSTGAAGGAEGAATAQVSSEPDDNADGLDEPEPEPEPEPEAEDDDAPDAVDEATAKPTAGSAHRSINDAHIPPSLRGIKTSAQLYAERQAKFNPTPYISAGARKVRGGVKLSSKEGPVSLAWSAQRWMRLVEDQAPNDLLAEGLTYARNGQTKTIIFGSGIVSARVQGRLPNAYVTEIRLPTFTFAQWEQVLETIVREARPLASLLAGEVPQNIDDCFASCRLNLFPIEPSDVSLRCSCHAAKEQFEAAQRRATAHLQNQNRGMASPVNLPSASGVSGASAGPSAISQPPAASVPDTVAPPRSTAEEPWCKHVCCVMALIAERLASDTFTIFQLRGLGKDDLLERLRQRRAVTTMSRTGTLASESASIDHPIPVYQPQIAGVTDAVGIPLDQTVDNFWQSPTNALDTLELPVEPPAVSHPLLRRLGSSPFIGAKFPLVGLLATCYESIGGRCLAPDLPMLALPPAEAVPDPMPALPLLADTSEPVTPPT